MNVENVMEPLRNSEETLSTENFRILRNFQYWTKFLVSYLKKNPCKTTNNSGNNNSCRNIR